jgi:hypothetical protein
MSEAFHSKQEHLIYCIDDLNCVYYSSSPRQLDIVQKLSTLWLSPEKFVLPFSLEDF